MDTECVWLLNGVPVSKTQLCYPESLMISDNSGQKSLVDFTEPILHDPACLVPHSYLSCFSLSSCPYQFFTVCRSLKNWELHKYFVFKMKYGDGDQPKDRGKLGIA